MSIDGGGQTVRRGRPGHSRDRPLTRQRTGTGRPSRRATQGFTLLEVLLALTVIGMLMVGVLGAVSAGLRAEAAATDAREIASLSGDLLHSLALLPAEELMALDGGETRLDPPFQAYRWSARTRRRSAAPSLVEVDLVVKGPGRSIELFTLVHRPAAGGRE